MNIFIQYGTTTKQYKVTYTDFERIKQGILKRLGNIRASNKAEKERDSFKKKIKDVNTMDDFLAGVRTKKWLVWVEEDEA